MQTNIGLSYLDFLHMGNDQLQTQTSQFTLLSANQQKTYYVLGSHSIRKEN